MKAETIDLLFRFGRTLSPFYANMMKLRQKGYETGLLKSRKLPCPVISIGNIVMGGTGKTPHVIAVAAFLKASGKKPAVISRGYGGRHGKEPVIVHDGSKLCASPDIAGDEPVMTAEALENVPVVVHKKRYIAGLKAIKELGADLIILDDGFQHLSLRRDIDIVLLNSFCPFGNGRVFPGGDLREGKHALKRADIIVLTKSETISSGQKEGLRHQLHKKWPDKPIFFSENKFSSFTSLDNKTLPLDHVHGMPILAFCGLAHPDPFFKALKELDAQILYQKAYPDHHKYKLSDINDIYQRAEKSGAKFIITTKKDGTKIKRLAGLPGNLPILQLNMEAAPEAGLFNVLKAKLGL